MTRLRGEKTSDWVRPEEIPEGSVLTVFRVPAESAGQRLDVFLQGQLRRTSRTRTQAIVRVSAFDETGRRVRVNDRVRAAQHILLWRPPWDEVAVPTDIPILYEDEHLLAVDKPALLPVHPSARYHKNTLIKLLMSERPGEFLSLGHRLDRETSGVLLVSKTAACDRTLKRDIEMREDIEKEYLAITWGVPLGVSAIPFRFERNVMLDPAHSSKVKMMVSDAPDSIYACTVFSLVRTVQTYSLVQCMLETGRQHQIRVHLAALDAPVVGDKLYGPDDGLFARGADGELTADDLALLELPRHALHAHRISLPHPMTRKPLTVEAPLPADMADFLTSRAESSIGRPDRARRG